MPQPNKGGHGTAPVAVPVQDKSGSKSSGMDNVEYGMHTKGTKGKG